MKFLLKYKILASIAFFVLQGIYLFTKPTFSRISNSEVISWISLFLLFIFWAIVFLDVLREKPYNRTFWILAHIITPFLAPVFYLFQRERLLSLRDSKFRTSGRDS